MEFDKVLCLTLCDDIERQQSASKQLKAIGITDFDFVFGVDAYSAEVENAYRGKEVMQYPGCFRCGRERCECPNNVLMPTQVGNFLSYVKIWRLVAQLPIGHLALVVEDDVFFTWYSKVLRRFYNSIFEDLKEVSKHEPTYIRMGWAECRDHRRVRLPRYSERASRMSNPCFAINPAAAESFLQRFKRIETTSDIFMNEVAHQSMRGFTVFPPLACDLSWSKGVFDSRIMRRKRFRGRGRSEAGDVKRSGIAPPRRPVGRRAESADLGVIGHPRCGSGYMASLLHSMGYDIGHEKLGKDGISSWMHVVKDWWNPFGFDDFALSGYLVAPRVRVLHVRDPRRALPSIVLENSVERSFQFRRKHIQRLRGFDLGQVVCRWERALLSYVFWYDIALVKKPDLVCRIEDGQRVLIEQLEGLGFPRRREPDKVSTKTNSNKKFGGRELAKPVLLEAEWAALCGRDSISQHQDIFDRLGYGNWRQFISLDVSRGGVSSS